MNWSAAIVSLFIVICLGVYSWNQLYDDKVPCHAVMTPSFTIRSLNPKIGGFTISTTDGALTSNGDCLTENDKDVFIQLIRFVKNDPEVLQLLGSLAIRCELKNNMILNSCQNRKE